MVGKSYRRAFGIAPAIACAMLFAAIVLASGSTADRVLGQFDFTHVAANLVDAKGLSTPHAVAIDSSTTPNRIYVADAENSRVLGWKNAAAFANGAPADLVIGQPDFISNDCVGATASSLCTPLAAAVDVAGNLYVADSSNSRVLEYTNPFSACSGVFPCVGGPPIWCLARAETFRRADVIATPAAPIRPPTTCACRLASRSTVRATSSWRIPATSGC